MGSQKSQEEVSMVSVLQPSQFAVVEARREWQLWEDRISTRRYMVFTLDDTALSEHNLQIYHFRKLNRAYLSGVHALTQDEPGLCATPNRTLLLLDDLPFTLADFGRSLTLQEGLTVLQVALAGYRIMSYLFGPLMSSPDMICFTEAGVPKVWANQQLQLNEASQYALRGEPIEAAEGKSAFRKLSIAQKKVNSIRSILRSVSTALSQPFSSNFLHQFEQVRSYEEAEEALELFCRREGIELQEWIEARPILEQRTLIPVASGPFLSRVVSQRPISHSYVYSESPAFQGQSIQQQQRYYKLPPVVQSIPQAQPVYRSFLQKQLICSKSRGESNPLPMLAPPLQYPYQSRLVTMHPVVTETIITSFPLDSQQRMTQQQLKAPPLLKTAKISADDRMMPAIAEQHCEQRVEEKAPKQSQRVDNLVVEEGIIPTRQEISSSEISQSSHEQAPQLQQNYQLVVHEITDNSHSHDREEANEEAALNKTIEMQEVVSNRVSTPEQDGKEEIELWEESMQKMAKKMTSRQSSENYRSEERDQVMLPDNRYEPPQQDIADFKSQEELERYIRNKYSEYFTEKEPPKNLIPSPSHHHTSSLDKQLFEKKVAFAADVPERDEEEEPSPIETGKFVTRPAFDSLQKYTFGNIELEPSYASAQYQSALSKPAGGTGLEQNRRRKKIDEDSINARYSKYVVNRSFKSVKPSSTSQFGRDRAEAGGTYDDLRRLLRQ